MPRASSFQVSAISIGSAALGAVAALLALRVRLHWVRQARRCDQIDADLVEWLSSQGLARYALDLARHGYDDLGLLAELTASEVEEMICVVRPLAGHAARFRKSLDRLRRASAEATLVTRRTSRSAPVDISSRTADAENAPPAMDALSQQAASCLSDAQAEESQQDAAQSTAAAWLAANICEGQAETSQGRAPEATYLIPECRFTKKDGATAADHVADGAPERGTGVGSSSASSSTARSGNISAQLSAPLSVGSQAVLSGLARRPELNGRVGNLTAWDEQSGRWEFAFGDGSGTIKVRSENVQPVSKTAAGASRNTPEMQVPDEFRCCITQDVMERPVITSDGHTYERTAIAKWLEEHNTSPKTGQELPDCVLRPNHSLRAQILAWRERQGLPPLPPWEPEPQETVQQRANAGQSSETMHAMMIQTPAGSITVPLAQVQVNNGTTTIVGNQAWLTQLLQTNERLRTQVSDAWRAGQSSEQAAAPDPEELTRLVMREPRLLENVMQFLHNDPEAQSQVPILAGHGLPGGLNPAMAENPLFRAAREGETGVVEQLLGPNTPERFLRDISSTGDSLLHVASWCGHLRLTAMLLARGHPLHVTARNRSTALHYASWRGHVEVARQLLEARADTERKMMGGDTALHQAAWQNHADIIALLLDRRAEMSATKDNGDSALALAAVRGQVASCNVLLTRMTEQDPTGDVLSSGLSRRNGSGRTALHAAASSGNEEIVQMMLEARAAINAKANNDEIPLHHAVQAGSSNAVRTLLEARAELDIARMEDQSTPMDQAIFGGRAAIIPILVEHGADPSSIGTRRDGIAPIHMAVLFEVAQQIHDASRSVITALLEARADLEVRSRGHGMTPLHIVFGHYHQAPRRSSTLRLLLERRADVEAAHRNGERALHMAVSTNLRVEAAILLECRAQVNATMDNGRTPLHLAAQHGAPEIAQLLLLNGANASACNQAGQTPEDVANQYGLSHVAELLNRHANIDPEASRQTQTEANQAAQQMAQENDQ